MSIYSTASDWQACGVASVGGAEIVGGIILIYEFRSKHADCRANFTLQAVAFGGGGSLGGAVAPSPSDFYHNTNPDLWTPLSCKRRFSAYDLDWAYGALSSITVSAAYGYNVSGIAAGLVDTLFEDQNVSGWNVGVGATAIIAMGVWKLLSDSAYY